MVKKSLRKPENWQDFETLCLKLWSEIWQCPEAKKHGRNGQVQHGVDVYGIPRGETSYYGIQCKGKDEYTHVQLTTKEIDNEIAKAMTFQPTLRKFYFATTADKDATTETYIRMKNTEHMAKGLFEIHLFDWADIVHHIDENKVTHDWYVNSIGFKNNHSVKVTFDNGKDTMMLHPSFLHVKSRSLYTNEPLKPIDPMAFYVPGKKNETEEAVDVEERLYKDSSEDWIMPQPLVHSMGAFSFGTTYNKSCVTFRLSLHNTGNSPIKNPKLIFAVNGDFIAVDRLDKRTSMFDGLSNKYTYNVRYDSQRKECVCDGKNVVIVPGDSYQFDRFCLKPQPTVNTLLLHWRLLSEDYSDSGTITIYVSPTLYERETTRTTWLKEEDGKVETFYKNHYVDENTFYAGRITP